MLARASFAASYAASSRFEKKKTAEHERVERLVANLERSVRKAFLAFIENVQSPDIMRQVEELLGRNDVEGALRVVDRYVARLAPVLSTVFVNAAQSETAAIAQQVKRVSPIAGISFDPTHPRAAEMMRGAQLRFIREFSDSQRASVRQALSQALIDGQGPLEAARAFRNAIGLTANQEAAVRNYRRLLTEGNREALERDIRDRRFDPTVRRAVSTGEPLSAKQVDTMVDRYRQRYVMYRSEVIARTETADVVSVARQEALDQVVEDVDLADTMIERVWRSTKDKRTRDSHRAMDGQVVQGRKEPFVSGHGNKLMRPLDPAAPASERVQCRCVQIIRIKELDDIAAPTPATSPSRPPVVSIATVAPAAPAAVTVRPRIDTAALDAEARAYVMQEGVRHQAEFLDGYDRRTGERIERSTDKQRAVVTFSPGLIRKLEDPTSELVLHHNHPSSSSLSNQDLLMLEKFPGMHAVIAHGHDGSFYQGTEANGITRDSIRAVVDGKLAPALHESISAGRLPIDQLNAVYNHVMNLALDRAGLFTYAHDLRGKNRQVYDTIRDEIEALLDRVKW